MEYNKSINEAFIKWTESETNNISIDKNVIIDGHFWIEDNKGKTVYDSGFSNYSNNLPCFKNSDIYQPELGDFYCFQPALPHLEKQIVDQMVANLSSQYSKITSDFMEDPRTPKQRLLDACKNIFAQNKDTPFNCRQNAFCYFIINQKKKINIRFGGSCIVRPRLNTCYFFFGHSDNHFYEEWIVDVSSGNLVIKHDREVPICEIPSAIAELERKKKVLQEKNEKKRKFEAIKNKKEALIAEKIANVLIADEERLDAKKSKQLHKKLVKSK